MPARSDPAEILVAFLRLGLTSFGGPVAHLSYFHEEFVTRRRWLTADAYADIVALCQFLPGPASSQVGFAIGLMRGGLPGALAAWLGFTAPSAIVMIAFAYGVSAWHGLGGAGWLHGLKVAAVAVVAQAVWSMGRRLCPDRARIVLALLTALAVLLFPAALSQILALAAGAAAGWFLFRNQEASPVAGHLPVARGRPAAVVCLLLFFVLLAGLPLLAAAHPSRALASFESFYHTGALVFGGGHVMLPLLQARTVAPGWVGSDVFLGGYGAAQALPGPLFTFAAYLGTAMHPEPRRWLGGLWCLGAIFLPSVLLVLGVFPFWEALRSIPWVQAAMKGANAAVVGLLLAALYRPIGVEGIHHPRDLLAALAAFTALVFWKWPPWLVVALLAAGGALFL